jgi:DNA-binding MurR/RpiR family transcriptional regulator
MKLYTVKALAKLAGTSPSQINRLINAGHLASLPGFARPRRVSAAAWEAYLRGQSAPPPTTGEKAL